MLSSLTGLPASIAPASRTNNGVGATAASDARGAKDPVLELHTYARARHGDVHLVPWRKAQVIRSRARGRRGEAERRQQLPWPQGVLPRSRAEILNRHIPHPSGARDAALHSQGDQERDRIGAGRGVTQVPSDGSPALNLRSADYRGDFSELGLTFLDLCVLVDR